MPESLANAKERKRRARLAAHRAQAVRVLQIAECGCRYAASQLANGTSPEEARAVALEMAGELIAVAEALRRLTRIDGPAERKVLAKQLSGLGLPTKQIAMQLGVCDVAVRRYLRERR